MSQFRTYAVVAVMTLALSGLVACNIRADAFKGETSTTDSGSTGGGGGSVSNSSFCQDSFTPTDTFTKNVSINSQNGWSVGPDGFNEQVLAVGAAAHNGSGVWKIANTVSNGNFASQPTSPSLPQTSGESTVRSASGGDSMENVFYFRTVNSVADGSTVTVSLSPTVANRQTYVRLVNDIDANGGLYIHVVDTPSSNFMDYYPIQNLARGTWHKIRVVVNQVDGRGNDVVKLYINDVLKGTYTTWEDYYTDPAGWNMAPLASSRVMWRMSIAPNSVNASFVNGNAQGFYVDDMCYRIYNAATPSTTLQYYRTGFE